MGLSEEARLLWRGQMSFRLLLHAVLLYTILMCIIKIRSDLFKKKNAALEKENAEMQKKIPSTMDRLLEKKNLELLETRNFNLRQENKELKEALEEERSFSDRLLEGIDRVLDMLERHLPKQLLHLVDKARDLLPEHQTYRQEKQHERGHSWGDMSL